MTSPLKPPHNRLFNAGPNPCLNACVGTNGGPYDFDDYGEGYFKAGQRLIDWVIENERDVDLLVYPIVFNYRHGIELSVKDLARKVPRIWGDSPSVQATHKLLDNWRFVAPYLCRLEDFDPDGKLVVTTDDVLSDFAAVDAVGESFRFPLTKSGTRTLSGLSLINLEVFGDTMARVSHAFDWWEFTADRILSALSDAAP